MAFAYDSFDSLVPEAMTTYDVDDTVVLTFAITKELALEWTRDEIINGLNNIVRTTLKKYNTKFDYYKVIVLFDSSVYSESSITPL